MSGKRTHILTRRSQEEQTFHSAERLLFLFRLHRPLVRLTGVEVKFSVLVERRVHVHTHVGTGGLCENFIVREWVSPRPPLLNEGQNISIRCLGILQSGDAIFLLSLCLIFVLFVCEFHNKFCGLGNVSGAQSGER